MGLFTRKSDEDKNDTPSANDEVKMHVDTDPGSGFVWDLDSHNLVPEGGTPISNDINPDDLADSQVADSDSSSAVGKVDEPVESDDSSSFEPITSDEPEVQSEPETPDEDPTPETVDHEQNIFDCSPEFEYWFHSMVPGETRDEKAQNAILELTEMNVNHKDIEIFANDKDYYKKNWVKIFGKLSTYAIESKIDFKANPADTERWSRQQIEIGLKKSFDLISERRVDDDSIFLTLTNYYGMIIDGENNSIAPIFEFVRKDLESDSDPELTNKIIKIVEEYHLQHYTNMLYDDPKNVLDYNVIFVNALLKAIKSNIVTLPDYVVTTMTMFRDQNSAILIGQ